MSEAKTVPGTCPRRAPAPPAAASCARAVGGILAGVLAGLAQRFGIGAWTARVIFLLSMLLPGPQVVAYAVLWIVMPKES